MGSWIKTMRERRRMTQEEFIESLKSYYPGKTVAKSTLSGWEGGQKNPPVEDNQFISALAKVFNVTTADVLKGSGYDLGPAYENELDEGRRLLLEAYDTGDLERLVRMALEAHAKHQQAYSRLMSDDNADEGTTGSEAATSRRR